MSVYTRIAALPLLSTVVFLIVGCPAAAPPSGSVLAGSWRLMTDEPSTLPDTTLLFDADGNLINIAYISNGEAFNLAPLTQTTLVSGTSVTISAGLPNANTLHFVGTLNTDTTLIRGTLTQTVIVDAVNIVITDAPATLTKQ